MRLPLIVVALLSQTSAFQTSAPGAIKTRITAASTPCVLMSKLNDEPIREEVDVEKKKLIIPRKQNHLLSKLTTFQLSALTQLKKDERRKFNKDRLLKMGITMTAAFLTVFKKSLTARASIPLVVKDGTVKPLMAGPGMGIVEMPGMRGMQVGGLPNQGALSFALALFTATALLRSAGDGYARLMHVMAKYMSSVVKQEESDIDLGLPTETNWDEYSKLDPLQKKRISTKKSSKYWFNKSVLLFERLKSKAEDERAAESEKLEQATKFFREEQYKQHHHPVHALHSNYEEPSYLESLAINEEAKHDMPTGYLDTLSNAKSSSWDVYKHKLEDAKLPSEVDDLKQEVSNLRGLMQVEQSMYQTSNQALKLAMEAQTDELQHTSSTEELKDFDSKLSTNEELKAFDKKAREYENTVVKEEAEAKASTEKEKKHADFWHMIWNS